MIAGIGMDIVEVTRIEKALQKSPASFIDKLFTDSEKAYCLSQACPAIHFAARFAAKEAVSKALGTGIGSSLHWKEIEVLRNHLHAPSIRLHNTSNHFAKEHGITEILITLSHTSHYAAATALAIKNP